MTQVIFITGATGNIGARLVGQIIASDKTASLILLARGSTDAAAARRVEKAVLTSCPDIALAQLRRQTRVICGDISKPNLGLTRQRYDEIACTVTHIIHSAASTSFNLSLPCAREINVTGTENVLNFGLRTRETGRLRGVAHISTAFVCGYREGKIHEHELLNLGPFCSTYEQTKWEAECLVRKYRSLLPITVFRPSTVVGDSRTGRILNFNVMYTPLKFIGLGVVRVLAGSANVPLDIVPVDYVVRAIDHIFIKRGGSSGQTFNLVAGPDKSLTTGAVAYRAVTRFVASGLLPDKYRVHFIPASLVHSVAPLLTSRTRRVISRLKTFEPHLRLKRQFDHSNTTLALAGTNITVPAPTDYFELILNYFIECTWKRRALKAA